MTQQTPTLEFAASYIATLSLEGVSNYREAKGPAGIMGHSVEVLMKTYAAAFDEDKQKLMGTVESML